MTHKMLRVPLINQVSFGTICSSQQWTEKAEDRQQWRPRLTQGCIAEWMDGWTICSSRNPYTVGTVG
jgi:hypothetical protein